MWRQQTKYNLTCGEWSIARYRNNGGWDYSLFHRDRFIAHRQTEQELRDLHDELTKNPGMAGTTQP
jgi:hypothetical protein